MNKFGNVAKWMAIGFLGLIFALVAVQYFLG